MKNIHIYYTCNKEKYAGKENKMKLEKKINELKKVVSALIQLVLEIGTLIAIIKMILQSI